MLKIGVLVSGGGTNFQAIVDSIENGYIKNAKIVTLVSSNPNAYALERAKNHNIEGVCIRKKDFENSELYEKALVEHFNTREVDLVIMAGFMVVIGSYFINAFRDRIMNIHPSLIPSFCGNGYYGLKVHEAVLEKGVKVTGATVHFVTEETDAGPIILQKAVYIDEDDTPESLQKKVMVEAEWEIFPEAIKLFSEGKIKVCGNKVRRV
ncbi:MAG: phosphoribosylglycinamide formyltransferase [Tyzzerella sp.]|uniref:Phosphoribosylglycinamide formyltransferase n=1 Tax=Candidatus Fimicola merdigallinarum TaxID=2840819 RepID=A0A9D9H3W5_9FIRM|nr:phosphoribosylglycinamide formyltransferase [Candidatus Fimicola merdigallinarum]